jgi:hypothetical protein
MLVTEMERRSCPHWPDCPRMPGSGERGGLSRGITILQGVVAATGLATLVAGAVVHLNSRLGYLEWTGATRQARIQAIDAKNASQDDLLSGIRADLRAIRTDVRWLRERAERR